MSTIQDAFFAVCENAVQRKSFYVSLYCSAPFYGGPEEGGWWGSDTTLVSSQHCTSDEQAQAIRDQVETMANELSEAAKKSFYDHCARSMEWLEARGLEADYLPEPDGEEKYFVCVEEIKGEHQSIGDRRWS